MAKEVTLKSPNGKEIYYPKTVTDLVYDNETGKTVKDMFDTLDVVSKIKDESIDFIKIENEPNYFLTQNKYNLKGVVVSLYIKPEYIAGTMYGRPHNKKFIVGCSDKYVANTSTLKSSDKNKSIDLVIYSAISSEFSVGEIIGQIVIKDIDYCLNAEISYESIEKINVDLIKKENFLTAIDLTVTTDKIADSAVTTDKIADSAVTTDKIAKATIYSSKAGKSYTFLNSISELYIYPKYAESVNIKYGIGVKPYNYNLYIHAFLGNSNYAWRVIQNISTYENDKVYELRITQSTTENINVGDILGYIKFKDIASFRGNTQDTSYQAQPVNINYVTDLSNFASIMFYINDTKKVNTVEMFLPKKVVAVKDDVLQLFYRSIIKSVDPYKYHIVPVCSSGKAYPRYFTYKPNDSEIGKTLTFKFLIKDDYLNILNQKIIELKVVDKLTTMNSNVNVLCIGASETAGGQWVYELKRRLTSSDGTGTPFNPTGLGLNNITFVGRKKGTSYNVPLEATGGWRVQDYASTGVKAYRFFVSGIEQLNIGSVYKINDVSFTITEINVTDGVGNIRCTYSGTPSISDSGTLTLSSGSGDSSIEYSSYISESYNPFWNTETQSLDFQSYADKYCNGSIDLQIWYCGTNDIFYSSSAIPNVINAYKTILRAYHSDFPNGKVILSSLSVGSPIGGFGANYGASETSNYYHYLNTVFKYSVALEELAAEEEFSSFVTFSPTIVECDSENSYPYTDTPVNNRSEITEKLGTNGLHSNNSGHFMIADALYRTFTELYN